MAGNSSPKLFHAEWTKLDVQPDPIHGVPVARSSHGVSYLVSKDRLVVYGGEHVARTPLPSNQVFWVCRNASSDGTSTSTSTASNHPTWKQISTAVASPPPRIAHAQALVQDRYLYIFGGRTGIAMEEQAMNDLWVLDTESDEETEWTWTQVLVEPASGPCSRSFHRMMAIGIDLYVFGGCGASGRLKDLWKFDTMAKQWYDLGESHHLRGRGGPNLVALAQNTHLAVIAGFAGEETNDGHGYSLLPDGGGWESQPMSGLAELRPRSVCCSATLAGCAVIFGGEVDPSAKGHEGAGGFENDLIVLDGETGAVIQTIRAPSTDNTKWPAQRGWSDCDTAGATSNVCWIFGGLSGDDANPVRLGDLWRLQLVADDGE